MSSRLPPSACTSARNSSSSDSLVCCSRCCLGPAFCFDTTLPVASRFLPRSGLFECGPCVLFCLGVFLLRLAWMFSRSSPKDFRGCCAIVVLAAPLIDFASDTLCPVALDFDISDHAMRSVQPDPAARSKCLRSEKMIGVGESQAPIRGTNLFRWMVELGKYPLSSSLRTTYTLLFHQRMVLKILDEPQ